MKTIEKISQTRLKAYSKLTQKKNRHIERKFLVEGIHLVEEAVRSDWDVEAVILSDHGLVKEIGRLESWDTGRELEFFECSERDFKKLTDTVTSQGIVAVVKVKEYRLQDVWKGAGRRHLTVALDDIADPGNAGTILRTSDWFGVNTILLSDNSVDLFNSKVLRATMGAVFHLPIITDLDLSSALEIGKKNGSKVITTAVNNGMPLNKFSFPEKSIVVFGNEAHGVSENVQNLSDMSLTIPKFGKAESLNVAISCGIILNKMMSG